MATIAERRLAISLEMNKLQDELVALQVTCSHPAYEVGYSMMACVQRVLICTDCGHMKPLGEFEEQNEKWII